MENISLNSEASVTDAEGAVHNAKDILCDNQGTIKLGLEAIRNLIKNPILKLVVGSVITLLENILEKTCSK